MPPFIQIIEFFVDVAGEIRASIYEALDTEQQALSCFEMDAHGPKGNLELDNLSWRDLLFLVMWMIRNHGGAPLQDLSAM